MLNRFDAGEISLDGEVIRVMEEIIQKVIGVKHASFEDVCFLSEQLKSMARFEPHSIKQHCRSENLDPSTPETPAVALQRTAFHVLPDGRGLIDAKFPRRAVPIVRTGSDLASVWNELGRELASDSIRFLQAAMPNHPGFDYAVQFKDEKGEFITIFVQNKHTLIDDSFASHQMMEAVHKMTTSIQKMSAALKKQETEAKLKKSDAELQAARHAEVTKSKWIGVDWMEWNESVDASF